MRAGSGTPYHTRPTDVSPAARLHEGAPSAQGEYVTEVRPCGKKEGKSRGAGVGTHMATRFSCLSATPLHNFWADSTGHVVESALISYCRP